MTRCLISSTVFRPISFALVAEKKDDSGSTLQNLRRELERAKDLVGPGEIEIAAQQTASKLRSSYVNG